VHQLWLSRVMEVTANAWRFAVGTYSLAEAYTHVDQGGAYPVLPFGGINPRTLVAAHQVPPGTRIWSTDIDAYCMVPGCAIESVVSFKVSGKLDEILDGPPELAKQLLQEAGLNYFLISKYGQFLDLLPYSQLFAPSTIGQYLGVKWTDGSTFLLTWIGPGTKPIGDEFLGVYANILATPENPWFRFSELVAQIGAATAGLRTTTKWGTPNFPWRHQSAVSP
jgi:hypothetical protein